MVKLGPFIVEKKHAASIKGREKYTEMFGETPFEAPEDPNGLWFYDEEVHMVRR